VVAPELLAGRANLGRHWTVTTLMTKPEPLGLIRKPSSICTRAVVVTLVAAALVLVAATLMFVVAMMAGVMFTATLVVLVI